MSLIVGNNLVNNDLVLALDAENPVSYNASTWYDLTPLKNNAVNSSSIGTSTRDGVFCFDNDATKAGMLVTTNSGLESNSFTVSTWINADVQDAAYQRFWSYGVGAGYDYEFAISSAGGRVSLYDGTWRDTGYDITTSGWTMLTISQDYGVTDGTIFYANATNEYTRTSSAARDDNFYVCGAAAAGDSFNGGMGSFYIWNRALSAIEVAQNFNATRWRYGV